jgi:predicted nucleic acid-binding protein
VLTRLPAGTSVFIDANIFLYHLLDLKPSCTELFHRVQRRDLRGYTSTAVLSEVCHHLMLGEIGERQPVTPGGALRFLRQHPELIPTLTKAAELIEQIRSWRLRVLPVRWREFSLVPEIYQRFRLLTNDALIVATMRAHRLTHLASNDTDFTRVPGITLWRP